MEQDDLISAAETASILSISEASVRNWVRHGYLHKNDGWFDRAEVKTLLEKIRCGEIDRLNSRANKRHQNGNLLPTGKLHDIAASLIEQDLPVCDIMFLICLHQFCEAGLCRIEKPIHINENHCRTPIIFKHLSSYMPVSSLSKLENTWKRVKSIKLPHTLPADSDTAGKIYQALNSRGCRAFTGSFYTPVDTADQLVTTCLDMVKDKPVSKVTFIDPCCGTGQFLLSFIKAGGSPENAFGIDADPTAIFIAASNLLIQCPELSTTPRLFLQDGLMDTIKCSGKFDLSVTNPPWGAKSVENKTTLSKIYPSIKSGETFSYFINRCMNLINRQGMAGFVLPESILNVQKHIDIRRMLMEESRIIELRNHGKIFKGVYTGVVTLIATKSAGKQSSMLRLNNDFTFSIITDRRSTKLIDKLYDLPHSTLENNADWALGIVTGDNERYLTAEPASDTEPIIRGSNIHPGMVFPPQQHIRFTPSQFQQTAPEWKYRIKEKLVYRFISKKLIFAVECTGMLTLNSANILIPWVDGFTAEEIMNLFNSEIYNFVYQKRFNSVKILRSHLEQLPLVEFSKLENLFSDKELEFIKASL
ncbi:MAG: N-6 DNA methylase [Spirochaetales bacterium]|uniref:site-specific DNA-methyltransferase (adenine-specific) n=1 Tax=Candidatus Thalassospirochaeta sargassi TaxID=3119039 RepID=A0AAJ1MNU5_9SPIO|nr:N-6 DNA methylase [Spirochaetales bacterium]